MKISREALLAACIEALREQASPVSAARLRSNSKSLRNVSEAALERSLIEEARHGGAGVRLHLEGDLAEFSYAPDTPVSPPPQDGEARLYAPFAAYLEENGAKAFVLNHRRARRRRGDLQMWTFPDIVAVNRGEVIAFELKQGLWRRNTLWALSECKWNGGWANKRYVVAPAEMADRSLIEALPSLDPSLEIGIILLHCDMLAKRAPIISKAEVVLPAQRSEFDRTRFLDLANRWPDLHALARLLGLH